MIGACPLNFSTLVYHAGHAFIDNLEPILFMYLGIYAIPEKSPDKLRNPVSEILQ
jgi:hypothetical protein